MKFYCYSCGFSNRYSGKIPEKCGDCGETLVKKGTAKSAVSASYKDEASSTEDPLKLARDFLKVVTIEYEAD